MDTRESSPLRLLAPAALVVFGLALMLIVANGGGTGNSSSSSGSTKQEQRDLGLKRSRGKSGKHGASSLQKGVYIIKTGDTLAGIAQRAGISVSRIQELNPKLDPQALVSGQQLKLR